MTVDSLVFAQTLIALLAGHLLGDFVFQTGWMVRNKRRPLVLLSHVATVSVCTAVVIGQWHTAALLLTFSTHLAMDAIKTWCLPETLWAFVLDQLVHIGVCVAIAIGWPALSLDAIWLGWLPAELHDAWFAALTLLVITILAVPAGGYLIGTILRPMEAQLVDAPVGLPGAGQMIGWLERAMIVLFVMIDQWLGVGVVLAAKSILRFGDVQDSGQRQFAEYVIIGTFLSFGWAISVAVIGVQVLRLWVPAG